MKVGDLVAFHGHYGIVTQVVDGGAFVKSSGCVAYYPFHELRVVSGAR